MQLVAVAGPLTGARYLCRKLATLFSGSTGKTKRLSIPELGLHESSIIPTSVRRWTESFLRSVKSHGKSKCSAFYLLRSLHLTISLIVERARSRRRDISRLRAADIQRLEVP